MNIGVLYSWLVMLALLAATIYAHRRLGVYSPRGQVFFTRLTLGAAGLIVGWLAAVATIPAEPLERMVAFFTGFGLVHLPAAFMLYSKRLRGASR